MMSRNTLIVLTQRRQLDTYQVRVSRSAVSESVIIMKIPRGTWSQVRMLLYMLVYVCVFMHWFLNQPNIVAAKKLRINAQTAHESRLELLHHL